MRLEEAGEVGRQAPGLVLEHEIAELGAGHGVSLRA
jgi:hypothetical protein